MNLEPRFFQGQQVRIIPLNGSDEFIDRQIKRYAGGEGEVINVYCIGRDEMPELSKMFVYPDVFCYDVRLEGQGGIVRGLPEAALEECYYRRK